MISSMPRKMCLPIVSYHFSNVSNKRNQNKPSFTRSNRSRSFSAIGCFLTGVIVVITTLNCIPSSESFSFVCIQSRRSTYCEPVKHVPVSNQRLYPLHHSCTKNSSNNRQNTRLEYATTPHAHESAGGEQTGDQTKSFHDSSKRNNNQGGNNFIRGNSHNRSKPRTRKHHNQKTNRSNRNRNAGMSYQRATQIESQLLAALDLLQNQPRQSSGGTGAKEIVPLKEGILNHATTVDHTRKQVRFPSVRECNAALATFGDKGELLRALRLFVKMRKSANTAHRIRSARSKIDPALLNVPSPTLVTYSTLMSRAVNTNKAKIALRLWRIMTTLHQTSDSGIFADIEPGGAGTVSNSNANNNVMQTVILPDVRAVNILMNAHAKLADVSSAQTLLKEMQSGGTINVPIKLTPNLITYNTLIDACHRAGELGVALDVLHRMTKKGIQPDTTTYTSLIATVARIPKSGNSRGPAKLQQQRQYGSKDPDMAFVLLNQMIQERIPSSGKTYCALIDVCGRCGRSDLALKGLRMMLRQKKREDQIFKQRQTNTGWTPTRNRYREAERLNDEVGAWTAAINACGKSGRISTAIRLFHTMDRLGVTPNTVTCGCLADCLLRADHPTRISETLDVLRYMKEKGIEPSEVMYTSLIASAGRLVKMENEGLLDHEGSTADTAASDEPDVNTRNDSAKAIDVYTELMRSLMRGNASTRATNNNRRNNQSSSPPTTHSTSKQRQGDIQRKNDPNNTLLLKVFLVYQEMTSLGATPDIAVYNALLGACARCGDFSRSQDVFARIRRNGLHPNDISWREMLRSAARHKTPRDGSTTTTSSHRVEEVWDMARHYWFYNQKVGSRKYSNNNDEEDEQWMPNKEAFEALIAAYMNDAMGVSDQNEKIGFYQKVVDSYQQVLMGNQHHDDWEESSSNKEYDDNPTDQNDMEDDARGMMQIDLKELQESTRVMQTVLRAAVSMELLRSSETTIGVDVANRTDKTDVSVPSSNVTRKSPRDVAIDIAELDCLKVAPNLLDTKTTTALQFAKQWSQE